MGELNDLLAAALECDARGEPYALATVVAVRGSSYRRPGARLLVPARSPPVGLVSGGCLEGEAAQLTREALETGEARLATIDHSAEGEEVWGWGLGCRGAIDLLLEPPALADDTVTALQAAASDGLAQTLLTVLASDAADLLPGTRVRWDGLAAEVLNERLAEAVSVAQAHGRPLLHEAGAVKVAIDPIRPPLHLVVCGAGPDAEPLAQLARELGWRVTVADWRRRLLDPTRFAGARLCDADPALAADAVGVRSGAAAVVMTHDYVRDAEYLRGLFGRGLSYLGVLGPRERTERLLAELTAREAVATAEDSDRLRAPAGLDLGADGPAEVATSIVAEILAVTRGASARPLRERPGPIHPARQPPM